MQLATEEAQEMLLEEIPESPSAKPRHWYLAGAGLALLVVLGVAAKAVYRSPETLLQSTSSTNLSQRSFLGSAPSVSLTWFRELLTWARL